MNSIAPLIWLLGATGACATPLPSPQAALAAQPADTEKVAPDIAGNWWGTLDAGGQKLRLVARIQQTEQGYAGTVDSIDQGANGIEMSDITVSAKALSFNLPQVGGSYAAEWQDGQWVGTWSQGGASLPLTFVTGLPDMDDVKAPVVPENWSLPSDAEVASRLNQTIGDMEGVVGAVALVEDGAPRFVLTDDLDPASRFEIGSITKVFTALLLADLVLDGTVALDDPIADHVDGIANEAVGAITLRQLSNHFSGLPRLPENLMPYVTAPDPYAEYDEAMLLDFIRTVEPTRAPDEAYEYSNAAVGLLGHILGKAAGSDFKTALLERIVAPMGMNDTDFALDERSVSGHGPEGATHAWTFDALAGAGALRSTIADMATFAAIIADPSERWADHVAMITADQKTTQGGMTIGLGILTIPITEGGVLFHNGGTGGFKSSMWADAETKRAAVVLVNSSQSDPDLLGSWLISGMDRQR